MKVSVIVTIYNEEKVIDACVKSLLKQTYKDMELVLVNNGSKDNTAKVLKKYEKRKNITVVNLETNQQPGGGRNAGAKVAKGKIVCFVDADMLFEKDYIEILTKPIIEGKTIGTVNTQEIVANPENIWARSLCINRIPEDKQKKGSGVYRAILKDKFLSVGGFDQSKGYFDDDLSQLGVSTPVPAKCYHKNYESLSEAFFHSIWVGKSLMSGDLRRIYLPKVVASLLLIAGVGVLIWKQEWVWIEIIAEICLLFFLLFTLKKALPRVVKEHRLEYIVSIPILWFVRLLGYYIGALQKLI